MRNGSCLQGRGQRQEGGGRYPLERSIHRSADGKEFGAEAFDGRDNQGAIQHLIAPLAGRLRDQQAAVTGSPVQK